LLNPNIQQLHFLQTVTALYTSDYRIKGSKFLGYIKSVSNQADIDLFLDKVKSEHPVATHHCYAYRIDPNEPEEFDQDDGEPLGSAGLPILNALRSSEMINCMIVSVRYYGGTKLGKSGLIDAYGNSAKLCIENAKLKKVIHTVRYRIVYDYRHQGIIDKLKNDFPLIEIESSYMEKVEYQFGCPAEYHERLDEIMQSYIHLFDDFQKLEYSFHVEK
jgi:uncharacterized YigZ family protein